MQKYINLYEVIKLIKNEDVSKKYFDYLRGETTKNYRHNEIINIKDFLEYTQLDYRLASGYLIGYEIPQLSKEFDLIKITPQKCINIEIKGNNVSMDKVKKQLIQNHHYLKIIKKKVFVVTYFAHTNEFYTLVNEDLQKIDLEVFKKNISVDKYEKLDIDEFFAPKNILVSPISNPEKFISGNYLLTEHQKAIKTKIIESVNKKMEFYHGITGNAGTGKTLLIYDIAKSLSSQYKVVIIHGGILSPGHKTLTEKISNITIIPIKNYEKIRDISFDVLITDETHRFHKKQISSIIEITKELNVTCIFSYDEKQRMSHSEFNSSVVEIIKETCSLNHNTLTNKIRTNKDLSYFITCLYDLSKINNNRRIKNVEIIYVSNNKDANELAELKKNEEYTYITYTTSLYNSNLDYQDSENSTHKVIGQEFDNVCMVLNESFYYKNNKLKSEIHPNPNYVYNQLLYQGLTRARNKLLLLITNIDLLSNILKIFNY